MNVSAVGNPLAASASGLPTSGTDPAGGELHRAPRPAAPRPTTTAGDFGDGSAVSTAQNPSHTYSTVGHVHSDLDGDGRRVPGELGHLDRSRSPPDPVRQRDAQRAAEPDGHARHQLRSTLNWQAPSSTGGETHHQVQRLPQHLERHRVPGDLGRLQRTWSGDHFDVHGYWADQWD